MVRRADALARSVSYKWDNKTLSPQFPPSPSLHSHMINNRRCGHMVQK